MIIELTKVSYIANVFFLLIIIFLLYTAKDELYQKYIVPNRTNKIVMLGNSLTRDGGKWEFLLKRNDVVNSGVGGFTTKHLIWILKRDVYKYQPQICFVEGGINDLGIGIPVNNIFQNYKTLVDSLKSHNIIPVIQSTIYTEKDKEKNQQVESLNSLVREYAMDNNIDYIDLNQHLSSNNTLKKEYSRDGIHLHKEAYLPWRDEVLKVLKKHNI